MDTSEPVGEVETLLAAAVTRVMRRLASATATVYLPVPGEPELRAAVVAVSSLGLAPVERVLFDDPVLPSAAVYRQFEPVTAHSVNMIKKYPELAVFAPFPFTISAVPLLDGNRCLGTLSVFWPRMFHEPKDEEIYFLSREAEKIVMHLKRREDSNPVVPGRVPMVVAGEEPGLDGSTDGSEAEAPAISYHLQKLIGHLSSVSHTEEAVKFAIERVMSGFGAQAMALSLVEADRLRVIGSANCSREYLRAIDGLHLSKPSMESQAINGMRTREFMGISGDSDFAAGTGQDDTWVVLPMLADGKAIGACSLAFSRKRRSTAAEQAALTALATVLGFAFDRTRTFDAHYLLAQQLQQALLPRSLPPVVGVLSTSRYVPAVGVLELGGDWYDLMRLPNGAVAAVIGDVQGHSTTAAVVMGQLRSGVRAYAAEGHGPGAVLERANQQLLDLETELLATCCCVWISPDTGRVQISTAGHPVPLIRNGDGRYWREDIDIGIPLGVEERPRYETVHIQLSPGATLALFTDGLVQPSGEMASDVFESALTESDGKLETLGDRLVRSVAEGHSSDDAALLLLRYEGPPSPAHAVGELKLQRHDLQGVRRARIFLREWLQECGLESLADQAELLMSEVVTNALVHGDSDVDVQLRGYPDRLHVAVLDSDPHLATPVIIPKEEEDQAEGGRGLLIVSALAGSWGNSPNGQGKTVWFDLPGD
ncbi:SpoIIE family protein phosphatase [Streptomyces sp. NPDC051664]|uniref:ATP-binding SpoIIE family protein phosphatase n=1 Tax=Streptomyces sp. NPDC051664 TaxID=3365668 RepID=UPI0037ADC082